MSKIDPMEKIKEIIRLLEDCIAKDLWFEINNENSTLLGSYINNLQQEKDELEEENDTLNERVKYWVDVHEDIKKYLDEYFIENGDIISITELCKVIKKIEYERI